MTKWSISSFISRLTVSLLLLLTVAQQAEGQKIFRLEKDSISFFRGFALSFDLVGPAKLMLGDYGEYEGALRINLHDQWFPVFELGLGRANHEDDEVTHLTYKTTAPYFRIGMDWNIKKQKHDPYRIYAGFRYAFTNYKCDILHAKGLEDHVWNTKSEFGAEDISCNQHWLEGVFGIDASIIGPFHLGWTVRYKRRLYHKEGDIGNSWYVPGFGLNDSDNMTVNFNVIIDI
jgi:hypothetical protein